VIVCFKHGRRGKKGVLPLFFYATFEVGPCRGCFRKHVHVTPDHEEFKCQSKIVLTVPFSFASEKIDISTIINLEYYKKGSNYVKL